MQIKTEILKKLNLPWKIVPNLIENEYIEWIKKTEVGNYLLTWPWKIVKFLPLLAHNYLLENNSKKVVIICDTMNSSEADGYVYPDIENTINNLWLLDQTYNKFNISEIRKFFKKIDKIIIKKRSFFKYYIRIIGKDYKEFDICPEDYTQKKCSNWLIKQLENSYGKNSIRNLELRKKNKPSVEKIYSANGFIDIVVYEQQDQWSGSFKYSIEWLWIYLMNFEHIKYMKDQYKIKYIYEEAEFSDSTAYNLYFINEKIESEKIFSFLQKIKPDLLLFGNADYFIKDLIYGGMISRSFRSFLQDFNKLILLFSTDREIRHLYKIDQKCFGILHNIVPHTWDTSCLLNEIKSNKWIESSFHNPISSKMDEIPIDGTLPEINYKEIVKLRKLDQILKKILDSDIDLFKKNCFSKFFTHIQRSTLLVKGDYRKSIFFSRKINPYGDLTYSYIENILIRYINNEHIINEFKNTFSEIYKIDDEKQTNPILEEIIELVLGLINENYITLIVHHFDKKGTIKLLLNSELSEFMPERFHICTWGELKQRELSIENNRSHYIISSIWPTFNYKIYFNKTGKFIFIGNAENIDRIKKVINNRILDINSRPIYFLSEDDKSPPLLKSLQAEMDLVSNIEIQNIIDETIEISQDYRETDDISEYFSPLSDISLKVNERALLMINNENQGIFIPVDTSLLIVDERILTEIKLNVSIEKLEDKIKNRNILLDKYGTYISFREIFTKFMVEYDKDIKVSKGPYTWNNFQELFIDSNKWIFAIVKVIDIYSKLNNLSFFETEKKIAAYLSTLDLTAKDENYIKSWWTNFNEISTKYGSFLLFKTERPKSHDDVIRIFEGLNDLIPDLNLNLSDASKSYIATLLIQNIRNSLLKGKIKGIISSLRYLYLPLEKEISKILDTAEVFLVKTIHQVRIAKEVNPFVALRNFKEFIKK